MGKECGANTRQAQPASHTFHNARVCSWAPHRREGFASYYPFFEASWTVKVCCVAKNTKQVAGVDWFCSQIRCRSESTKLVMLILTPHFLTGNLGAFFIVIGASVSVWHSAFFDAHAIFARCCKSFLKFSWMGMCWGMCWATCWACNYESLYVRRHRSLRFCQRLLMCPMVRARLMLEMHSHIVRVNFLGAVGGCLNHQAAKHSRPKPMVRAELIRAQLLAHAN